MRVYALYTSDKNRSRRQEYYLLPQDKQGYIYTRWPHDDHIRSRNTLLVIWVYVRATDIPAIRSPHLRRNPKARTYTLSHT